jgi:hypothetical protein
MPQLAVLGARRACAPRSSPKACSRAPRRGKCEEQRPGAGARCARQGKTRWLAIVPWPREVGLEADRDVAASPVASAERLPGREHLPRARLHDERRLASQTRMAETSERPMRGGAEHAQPREGRAHCGHWDHCGINLDDRRQRSARCLDPKPTPSSPGARSACARPGASLAKLFPRARASTPLGYSISKPHSMFLDDPELPFERLNFE